MRILDHYIARAIISATLMVLLVLLGIETFMELIRQMDNVGKGSFGILTLCTYVVMQVPADLYQLFPMAGFIGSLIGLGRLASNSELLVMRSAGVSMGRIAWAVIKAACILLVFVTVLGEGVAPVLLSKANQLQRVALGKAIGWQQLGSVWLRRGDSYINVGEVQSPTEIKDVVQYRFDTHRHLLSASYAARGAYVNGEWTLYDTARSYFTPQRVTVRHIQQEPLGFVFRPTLLKVKQIDVGNESLVNLVHNIQYRQRAGLVSSQFEFSFWQRVLQPLTTVVMICLGVPFVFGSLREASMGSRILVGIIVGFVFYMLNQLFGPITLLYQFPPWLAALMPTVLFLSIYAVFMGFKT